LLSPNVQATVKVSAPSASLKLLASGARDDDAVAEYRNGMIAAVQSMATSATSIVILSPPPIARSLPVCATAGASPRSCRSGVDQPWFSQAAADREAAAKAHVRYLDARLLFCNGANWCPAFIGTTPVRYDGTHMTKAFANVVAPHPADRPPPRLPPPTSAGGAARTLAPFPPLSALFPRLPPRPLRVLCVLCG